jgi:pimeloyl-ACP methyl ester carboxylesterase
MALVSSLIAAAGRYSRVARAAAYAHARLAESARRPKSAAARPGQRGQVAPPRAAWFVEGHTADLVPVPVPVAYERHGVGEPLVLLHGLGHHRQAWDEVVPLLADERETIAMDLPGFGQSPDLDPAVPRDLETAVAWLATVFAALDVERPHVVGHSLGGLIALRLGQAGLVRSVTAIAPAGFWTDTERRYTYTVLTMARHGVRLLPDEAMGRLVGTVAGRAFLTGTLYGESGLWAPETVMTALRTLRDSEAFTATLRAGRAPGLFTGDIPDVPVTIAWGTRDRLLPPRQAARVKAKIPHARLVPLPGCGHVPMIDAPELAARVILEATGSPGEASPARQSPNRTASGRARPV